jgi:hypothetical protein
MLGNLVNHKNYRMVFFDIKQKTDELLSAHNNVDFMKNPAVDVDAIAIENGVIEIIPVPKNEIPGKHATLKNGVIKLSDEKSEDQRFSTGHELEHHIKEKADKKKKKSIRYLFERIKGFFKNVGIKITPDKQSENQVKSVLKEAARSCYDRLIQELKEIPYFTIIAKPITDIASYKFGKSISEDKAYNSIAKLIRIGNQFDGELILKSPNEFILKAADDLYNEEIADYFSANLLVPIERFVLWEDKLDDEIAAAFQVTEDCIKKRREEVELELEYLAE